MGQAKLIMWGGRHSTLHAQVFGPLESPLEMNSSRLFVAERVARDYAAEYEAVFGTGSLAPLTDTGRFPPLGPTTTGCRLTEPVDHPGSSRRTPPTSVTACPATGPSTIR